MLELDETPNISASRPVSAYLTPIGCILFFRTKGMAVILHKTDETSS